MRLAIRFTLSRVAVGLLAGLALVGCPRPQTVARIATEQEILSAVQSYTISDERTPRNMTDSGFPGPTIDDASAPNLWIATMTPLSPPSPGSPQLLARIRSTGPYAHMGIEAGMNYIYRDDTTGIAKANWTYRVKPARVGSRSHPLTRVPGYEWGLTATHAPNLLRVYKNSLAFVVCLDDCPPGHCGYR